MVSDSTDPTRRKHRHSSSDDDEAPSKRRKHRHHRHHRRHHHHRSKKRDKAEEATEVESEVGIDEKESRRDERAGNDIDDRNHAVEVAPEVGAVADGLSLGIDYDMEEGEIIEENAGGGVRDAESGEIEESHDFDDSNTGAVLSRKGKMPNPCLLLEDTIDKEFSEFGASGVVRADSKDSRSADLEKHGDEGQERRSRAKHVANGDFIHQYFKDDSLVNKCRQRNNSYDFENDLRDQRHALSSDSGGKRHRGLSSSSSQERHHEEGYSRNRIKSPEPSRRRSCSHSTHLEVSQSDTPKEQDDFYYSKRKHRSDSDDERVAEPNRNYRHGSRDLLRDKEREQSSGYSRHISQVDRRHNRETRDQVTEGSRDVNRDTSRERERERERGRARERERERKR